MDSVLIDLARTETEALPVVESLLIREVICIMWVVITRHMRKIILSHCIHEYTILKKSALGVRPRIESYELGHSQNLLD
jgi:hypothetical protein